jgi:flagellum-specific ATP synthase
MHQRLTLIRLQSVCGVSCISERKESVTGIGFEEIATILRRAPRSRPVFRISDVQTDHIEIKGGSSELALGHQVRFVGQNGRLSGEVIGVSVDSAKVVVEGDASKLRIGDAVTNLGPFRISPNLNWIGRVIDPSGQPIDGMPLAQGGEEVSLFASPPPAALRRGLGRRLQTGLNAMNTFLPVVSGQRLGLFAGAGVGKSTLLGSLAANLDADVCVVALVGERGREVGAFVRQILGKRGMEKAVVIAATSDQPALTRRRAAFAAMAVAEYFRDAGQNTLLVLDSVTRLAEAHREIAVAAGELPAMRGHPPSIVPLLASLAERAGPGMAAQGDITAVFSVLVAGADMDEPIADTLRGLLDGHIVLSRQIAERGRFPAFDLLRSVSRALPDAATNAENATLSQGRALLNLYVETEVLVRSGLYRKGANSEVDRAVEAFPLLEQFIVGRSSESIEKCFEQLSMILEGSIVVSEQDSG